MFNCTLIEGQNNFDVKENDSDVIAEILDKWFEKDAKRVNRLTRKFSNAGINWDTYKNIQLKDIITLFNEENIIDLTNELKKNNQKLSENELYIGNLLTYVLTESGG